MGKIKNTRVLASDPETTSAPRFNFRQYRVGDVYHNDGNDIDFVTDNKSLYVCLVESVQASKENIAEQEGLLKLVSQGEQGIPGANGSNGTPGVTPRIDAHFDGKQMIVTVNGAIKAVSPDLGGPSWKPVVDGTTLSWELTTDRYSPAPIDLTTLRPISEHPILLRTNSDNTKYDWETSGPANYIQWKYEGDEYWNNLISISELMNLALAGVSFWYNEDTQEWHFGHKEVIRASYTADKNGRKIISDVELGDILFDAGAVPMPNYEFDIQEIQTTIEQIQASLEGYATKQWVQDQGYLTGVDLDDYVKRSEIPELTGDFVKTITIDGNTKTPDTNGNISFSLGNFNLFNLETSIVGGKRHLIKIVDGRPIDLGEFENGTGSFDVKIENNSLYKSTDNGTTWTLVGSVSGSGEGCAKCWDEDEILALFANNTIADLRIVNGVLQKKVNGQWSDVGNVGGGSGTGCDECFTTSQIQQMIASALAGLDLDGIVRIADLDGYVKISDLDGYATKTYVEGRIQDIISGTTDLDYYRIFLLYQRTNSRTEIPNVPVTGNFVWDTTNGQIILRPEFESNWTNHPENATAEKPYLWMTSATYSYKTKAEVTPEGASSPWETPICLTGEDGKDGVDGVNLEFAYILCKESEYAQIKNIIPVATYGDGRPDDLPSGTTASGNAWLDHPSGISREYPIEAATVRKKNDTGWSAYCKPFIWSKWGEDGVDGDGVEYVFARATEEQTVLDAAGDTRLVSSYTRPSNSWAYDSPVAPWHDNPMGTTEAEPYVFCSKRKTVDADANEKVWGPWSEPSLWSNYAKKGDPGEPGGPGPAGPAGDQYRYVYALTNDKAPISKFVRLISANDDSITITQDSEEYQNDDYCPKFEFTFANEDPLSVRCTLVPQGVSSSHRYEYVSVRRKHEGVWGPFSSPALHNNFVEAGLTDEQLEEIKQKASEDAQENINAAIAEIDAAKERLTATENRLDEIEETGAGILQNPEEAVISIITNYKDEDQKSFADLIVDGKEAQIKQWAGAEIDDKLTDAGITVDGIAATVTEWADFKNQDPDGDGSVFTVIERLNAQDATITDIAAAQTEQGAEITSAGERIDGLESSVNTWANRLNVVEGDVTNVQSELNAATASLTNTAYSGKYVMDAEGNFTTVGTDEEPAVILGRSIKVCGKNEYEIVRQGLASDTDSYYAIRTYYIADTGEYVPIYHEVELDTENNCISSFPYTNWLNEDGNYIATDAGVGGGANASEVYINSETYPIKSGLNAMVLVSEALSQIKQTPGEVDIVANWGADTWAQIIAKANEEGSSITLDADHINLNGDTSATKAIIGNAEITDATITGGTITTATIDDCTINSVIRSADYDPDIKTGFLIDPQAKDFAFYADNAKFDNENGLVFSGNQTISWEDVENKPTVLDDDHLNTIITRDSLTTNKITTNEIESGAITADKIAAGAITTDKITVGTLNGDRIQDYSISEDKLISTQYSVTLDLENNQKPVSVGDDNKLSYSGDLYIGVGPYSHLTKNDGSLLDWDAVYLGKFNSDETITWSEDPSITFNAYDPTEYPSRKISIDDSNITYWISGAQASEHRLYRFFVHATIQDRTLEKQLIIPIKIVSGNYIGIDYVCFNPVKIKNPVEIDVNIGKVIKKESKTSTEYDPIFFSIIPIPYKFDTYEAAKDVMYGYRIDDASEPIWFNPQLNSTAEEKTVDFDKNGNVVSSRSFARLSIWQDDDINGSWISSMDVYLNDNDLQIEDKIVVSVAYDGIPTDEETLYVVYPEKGSSAYEVAVENGFEGTEEEWLASLKGNDGVPYIYQGEWVAGQSYYNNSQRIDLVKNTVNGVTGYYICRKTTNSSTFTVIDSDHPNNDWEPFVGQFQNVATNLLLAEHAYIENLGVRELATEDTGEGKITINKPDQNGIGDNAIKGYAHNSDIAGITISGVELDADIFEGAGNINYSASSMEYYVNCASTNPRPYAYEVINGSGDFYTTSTSTGLIIDSSCSAIELKQENAPTIDWRIEQGSTTVTRNNIEILNEDVFMLPYLKLVLVDVSNYNNRVVLGAYAGGIAANAGLEEYGYESYGGVAISPGTYKLVLIPDGDYMESFFGEASSPAINWADAKFYVTSDAGTVTLTTGDGTSTPGVTIAPNGIFVYFNMKYYFQFINTDDGVKAKLVVNGKNYLT